MAGPVLVMAYINAGCKVSYLALCPSDTYNVPGVANDTDGKAETLSERTRRGRQR